MSTYSVVHNETGKTVGVRLGADGAVIPMDADNADWQAFLADQATASPPLDLSDGPAPDLTAIARAAAKGLINADPTGPAKLARAVVLVAMDQINVLLDFDAQLKAAIAAATSLADLKARAAAITTNTAARTKAQLISAVGAKIDSGDSD